jgi:hypothetical protein
MTKNLTQPQPEQKYKCTLPFRFATGEVKCETKDEMIFNNLILSKATCGDCSWLELRQQGKGERE